MARRDVTGTCAPIQAALPFRVWRLKASRTFSASRTFNIGGMSQIGSVRTTPSMGERASSVFTCSGVCDYRITFGITP